MNKLVRHNLVRGLPTKCFENDHTCTACLKGKQHKASCKSKLVNSVSKPLHTLHMDLFGPTSTFFLKSKNETSGILKKFITEIENLKDLKVKIIRCDNEGGFKNKEMNDFCSHKRIKREFSNARTPQQNSVAKRRNRTLIEAARTMLADAKLPVTCWAEAVNTTCYVQNRVLINKSHNKTPYELFNGRSLAIGFLNHLAVIKPQDHCSTKVPEGSGNPNLTASTSNPSTDQMETLTVETPILTVSSPVPTAYSTDSQEPSSDARLVSKRVANQEETPSLDNILSLTNQFEDILGVSLNLKELNGVETDISNIEITITASPTHTLRIHKDHPKSQIISPVDTPIQTRNKSKEVGEQGFIATIHQKTDLALLQGKTHWDKMVKNKNDDRGIVIRNKSRLVAQGNTQEEGINYDEVFALVARIEAIRLFLAYASFIGFIVYQMDVKSAFLYGTIDKKVYVMQPPGFQDLKFLAKVYKVEKVIEFEALMHEKFQMSAMGKLNFFLGLQVLQKEDGIFLFQDKYVGDILKKFGYSDVRSSNTPMDKENPWGKDGAGKDVDLHLYRSMIGSLMYLTASRPDIMFAVCACARHQVTPKECHLHAVKRIFRYLKSHPKLGLWYPKESPFDFVAYSDSDYGGATQDRISTTGGCQFLGRRLISWQCKKQTIVATSATEAEYVAVASCCGQVLWIQNQLLDYG
nr:hypothetical protein [Tanacetum cinerariifolium]